MILSKNEIEIHDVNQWFRLAPPKKGIKQWVDGRSAKESAKAWIRSYPEFPEEIKSVLDTTDQFKNVSKWNAFPEYESKFDAHGEGANLDVLIVGENERSKILMGVEAKADEKFSTTIQERYQKAQLKLDKSPNSKAVLRIEQLVQTILGKEWAEIKTESNLRYQLFTGLAGTIAAANSKKCGKAIFLIHEFITDKTTDVNHRRNQNDLDEFVKALTKNKTKELKSGSIAGPVSISGQPNFDVVPEVYLAKASINKR